MVGVAEGFIAGFESTRKGAFPGVSTIMEGQMGFFAKSFIAVGAWVWAFVSVTAMMCGARRLI